MAADIRRKSDLNGRPLREDPHDKQRSTRQAGGAFLEREGSRAADQTGRPPGSLTRFMMICELTSVTPDSVVSRSIHSRS